MPGLVSTGLFARRQDSNHALHGDIPAVENVDVDHQLGFVNPPEGLFLMPVRGRYDNGWPAKSQTLKLENRNEDRQAKFLCPVSFNEESAAKHRHGSNDSEHDLAAMVHEYVENGPCDYLESSDSDGGSPAASVKLSEKLQALVKSSECPRDLMSRVAMLVPAAKEDPIVRSGLSVCDRSCARRFVVMNLRSAGYNAALCKSNWQNSGRVPGGEYEFIDVIVEEGSVLEERLIIDIDFRAQFEIARPTSHYLAVLHTLPLVFVGTKSRLLQVLEIMCEAAKNSLRQNTMPLPPWRTIDYMSAKWLAPTGTRYTDSGQISPCSPHWRHGVHFYNSSLSKQQSGELFRRNKVSLPTDVKGQNQNHFLPQLDDREDLY